MAGVGSWKAPRKYEDIAGTLDEHLCFAIIFHDFLWLYGLAEKKNDFLKILFHGPFLCVIQVLESFLNSVKSGGALARNLAACDFCWV